MGFWDEGYDPNAVKDTLDKATVQDEVLTVTAIRKGDTDFGPAYFVDVRVGDGEDATEGAIVFGEGVVTRDAILSQMREYMSNHPREEITMKIVKEGRTYNIVPTE